MSSSFYKFVYNNVEYNLSDIIASGSTAVPTAENSGGKGVINTSISSIFNPNGNINPVDGAGGGTSVTSELSNVGVDGQNTGFFKLASSTNTTQDIGDSFTAQYTDYFTYTGDGLPYDHKNKGNGGDVNITENLPDWVDHIVVLAVGGGGYVGNGKETDDEKHTSAEGGSGGFIAWKSPSGIKSYNVNIPRRDQGTHNGKTSTVRVYSGQNATNEVAWCQAYGGGKSVEPTKQSGRDKHNDDDTDDYSLRGGGLNVGGGYGNSHGSVLFGSNGTQGARSSGTTYGSSHAGSNNAQASRVHGWTKHFTGGQLSNYPGGVTLGPGQGAYWGNIMEHGKAKWNGRLAFQWDEYLYHHGRGDDDEDHYSRVLGGCNGAVRVYLKAVELS